MASEDAAAAAAAAAATTATPLPCYSAGTVAAHVQVRTS